MQCRTCIQHGDVFRAGQRVDRQLPTAARRQQYSSNTAAVRTPNRPRVVEQAPFASLKQAGAVRSSSSSSSAGRSVSRGAVGRRGGRLAMAAVEEPWFDEAKATVLLDHDQLE